jgi:DNA-binding MarR family transcriptional regulator
VIARHQPVSQREISDHLGLDASDVVGVLDILEAAHMVQRQRDPNDRRRHAVVLTERGETAAATSPPCGSGPPSGRWWSSTKLSAASSSTC